jgi:hypothetical protein
LTALAKQSLEMLKKEKPESGTCLENIFK